jgi:hypothetical protein
MLCVTCLIDMLSGVLLNAIMLNVIMLNAVAPVLPGEADKMAF